MKLHAHTGAFQTDWIPPGTQNIYAVAESDSWTAQSAPLTAHLSVSVPGTVDPVPRPSITTGNGVNVSRTFLTLTSPDGRTTHAPQISAKGEFSLAVPAGRYTVHLAPPAFGHIASLQATGAQVSAHSLLLSPGTSVKLTIHLVQANAVVSGVALRNGRPCAMIVLVPEDSTQSSSIARRLCILHRRSPVKLAPQKSHRCRRRFFVGNLSHTLSGPSMSHLNFPTCMQC